MNLTANPRRLRGLPRRAARAVGTALALALAGAAHAGLGFTQITGRDGDGPISLYYPTDAADQPAPRGRLRLQLAEHAPPRPGNGRLVLLSHGSGGSPWVHADLARGLTEAGFVVALPEHRGDNYRDDGDPGPASWAQRPAEVSRAIDAVAGDPRFGPLLRLDKVGVYGGSAGGHTALSLAGGRWSPGGFRRHCAAHLAEDFQSCVGLFTRLDGGWADGLKLWLARTVIGLRFGDDTPQAHEDARVAAVVAQVPFAADFDMASLARPRVPLGLVLSGQDRWLVPRFHGERVRAACQRCELLADLPEAGHGVMLSPLPPGFTGLAAELLNDPPGFDRAARVAQVERVVVDFMVRHLVAPPGPPAPRPAPLSAETGAPAPPGNRPG